MPYIGYMDISGHQHNVGQPPTYSKSGKVVTYTDDSIVLSDADQASAQIERWHAITGRWPSMDITGINTNAATADEEIGAGRGRKSVPVEYGNFELETVLTDDQIRAFFSVKTRRITNVEYDADAPFTFTVGGELKNPAAKVARDLVNDAKDLGWKVSVRPDKNGRFVDIKVRRPMNEEELADHLNS